MHTYVFMSSPAYRLALAAWGGSGDSPPKRKRLQAKKMLENAVRTPSRLHAVLGNRPRTPDSLTAQKHHRIQAQIVQRTLTLETTDKTQLDGKLAKQKQPSDKNRLCSKNNVAHEINQTIKTLTNPKHG